MSSTRKISPTVVSTAIITAAAIWMGLGVAGAVVRFARNSHKVDGFHAVPATTAGEERGRRLVATDTEGHLPGDIILVAPDSSRLGDRVPAEYEETSCEVGVVTARALIPGDVGGEYQTVTGTAYRDSDPPPIPGYPERGCILGAVKARHVGIGTYQIDFDNFSLTIPNCPPPQYESIVTVKGQFESPLMATTSTICDERDEVVEEVRIWDRFGVRQDASFTIILLTELPTILLP